MVSREIELFVKFCEGGVFIPENTGVILDEENGQKIDFFPLVIPCKTPSRYKQNHNKMANVKTIEMSEATEIVAYTDGSAKHRKFGGGSIINIPEGVDNNVWSGLRGQFRGCGRLVDCDDINCAEILAATETLRKIIEVAGTNFPIRIYTDSATLIARYLEAESGRVRVCMCDPAPCGRRCKSCGGRNPRRVTNSQYNIQGCIDELIDLVEDHALMVVFEKVKAHSGDFNNIEADKLAKAGRWCKFGSWSWGQAVV
jgi:ribonuclease HI